MEYFYFLKDSNGYIHSIDNLIVTYYVQDIGLASLDRLIDKIHKIKDSNLDLNYWENLNRKPCSRFCFYRDEIHLDDGIYILIGHYDNYEKEKGEMYVYPMIRLEINPNKHANKPVLKDFMCLVNEICYDGVINRYDYAIDIPCKLDDVQVFGSRKEKGLYKGTRYYGQRNHNGFCRIYDKGAEQKIEYPLTRVEHVISTVKTTKSLSLENVYIKDNLLYENGKLNPTYEVIVDLCRLCDINGLDYDDILKKLGWRAKKEVTTRLQGSGYKKLEYDLNLHDNLIEYYKDYFGIKEGKDNLIVDADGFINLEKYDSNLPFD